MFQLFRAIIREAVPHKQIWIFFVASCVCLPCVIEAKAIEATEMDSVFVHSSSMLEEFPFDFHSGSSSDSIQNVFELMPFEVSKGFSVNSFAEGGRNENYFFMPFSSGGQRMINPLIGKNNDKSRDNCGHNAIKPSFWLGKIDNPFNHDF